MSLSYLCTGFESQGPADCRQTVVRLFESLPPTPPSGEGSKAANEK